MRNKTRRSTDIIVNIETDSTQFTKGIKKIIKELNRLEGAIDKVNKSFDGLNNTEIGVNISQHYKDYSLWKTVKDKTFKLLNRK